MRLSQNQITVGHGELAIQQIPMPIISRSLFVRISRRRFLVLHIFRMPSDSGKRRYSQRRATDRSSC